MASGLIAALAGAGTITYTPSKLTKLNISAAPASTTYTVTLNGAILFNMASAAVMNAVQHWVDANQTVVITVSGSSSAGVFVSALEGQ